MTWRLTDGKLFRGENEMTFFDEKPVYKILEFGDRLIVLFSWFPGASQKSNVVCLDPSGLIMWRIKPLVLGDDDIAGPITNIWLEDGKLFAYFAAGISVIVDASSGEWVNADPGARPW
jgi:hypothetical protein